MAKTDKITLFSEKLTKIGLRINDKYLRKSKIKIYHMTLLNVI